MPSLTVENYCKAIFQLGQRSGMEWVATGQLATQLGVSPGSVTSMLKALAESALVEYRPYEGVRLTRSGGSLALRMVRRHRLIELFLVRTLGMTWDEVHDEAEHMEHAVSDSLIDRIDEFLGRPDADPHGDPIPSADGELRKDGAELQPLTECPAGARVRVARILDQGSDFLRFLTESGLEIGTEVMIRQSSREAGIVSVSIDEQSLPLGWPAAGQILVDRISV
ncbi:MAG: metal-dependent transcriptional regulator [Planctomycetaceae bacterium]